MRPPVMRPGGLEEPQDRERGHRLAAARFADEPERLAGGDLEAHILDRRDGREGPSKATDRF